MLGLSLVAASRGCSPVMVPRLLTAVASLVVEHGFTCCGVQASLVVGPGLQSTELIVVLYRFHCSVAGGISLAQGLNLYLLSCRMILYYGATREAPGAPFLKKKKKKSVLDLSCGMHDLFP